MNEIYQRIDEFCSEQHGSTNYFNDEIYVQGETKDLFAPLSFLRKKVEGLGDESDLITRGFTYASWDVVESQGFTGWYEKQFGKKMRSSQKKKTLILHYPDQKVIFDALETIHRCYDILRSHHILINGKNLPVQLGEWYAKSIFGLQQIKSTSQRGFDFSLSGKRVEVICHWAEQTSPKGVKVKKPVVSLSDCVIIIYLSKNFMIRDICYLDSSFIQRKFVGKGHTAFLKDDDIASYFFSKSAKHFDKVVNKSALMKFSNPAFAIKLDGRL